MLTLNVSTLVHDVTIQQLTESTDASGAPADTWTTLTQAWMGRESLRSDRSGEAFHANQNSGAVTTRWTMRYLAGMDPDLVDVPKRRRLLYQGRPYDIVSAETMDRKNGIQVRTLAHSAVA